ncbi:hypothetical protein SAMN02910358_00438 [Lachnospiraceae bacterium XBB1006]|nr:hypothetical protein SAMN02910358_00438 [Lachnospiraceae bacterium XBB1006]
MRKVKRIIMGAYVLALAIFYYIALPPINIHSFGLWMFVAFFVCLPVYLFGILGAEHKSRREWFRGKTGCFFIIFGAIIGAAVLIALYGAPFFHAKGYASVLHIKEKQFSEDIDDVQVLTKVALMDTDSARILGDRKIGSLSDVVSQFDVAYEYSQVDYQGSPLKVAPLEYAGVFKFFANKKAGVPGYVTVDPVGQSTRYVKLKKGMQYVPSAYLQKDLARHIRFRYPTAIFENLHFEIDEKGKPYFVASVMDFRVGLFGGKTVKGVILCDPVSGATSYYGKEKIPTWVDQAFSGDLLVEQFDWYGTYNNGFINSIFAKKGCRKSTETNRGGEDDEEGIPDYGYIAKEGDIWIYTGVTSVNEDASNIGFIMINERTGEAHYFSIPGADENSAMNAAEGEVQEKRYKASFPSLINVQGEATYVMLLKDANDIVKLYAMVNVEQYNQVTTGETVSECYDKYCKLLGLETDDKGKTEENEEVANAVEKTFTVKEVQLIVNKGETYVYFVDEEGQLYKQKFDEDETLLLIHKGDTLKAECVEMKPGIFSMKKAEKLTKNER